MTVTPLILASASEARAALLRSAGLDFRISPADIDEPALRDRGLASGAEPERIACNLAIAKARAVAAQLPGALVLGSDQVLVHNARIVSKPCGREEARDQLRQLRGDTHTLISAAALVRDDTLAWDHAQTVHLTMRVFSDDFLEAYLDLAGDGVFDSVGAYHLEGPGAQLFTRVDGDYFTVLGLPLLAVLQALRDIGHLDT